MQNKLSAGEISNLLYYQNYPKVKIKCKTKYKSGNQLHKELGFTNQKIYSRYYKRPYEDEFWRLNGIPDRINQNKGIVEELKTYRSERTKEKQRKAGETQINVYSFLTGLYKQKLYLYDTILGEYEEIQERCFDYDKFCSDVEKAIKIKKKYKYANQSQKI